jgi:predicted RNA-binding protein with RPS1 domain
LVYRERVSYHESIEEELKKNIESQVDVVLKMEEERLLMLKDNKDMRDKSEKIRHENDEYKRRMELFERELEELQKEIKENRNSINDGITTGEDVSESESVKKG